MICINGDPNCTAPDVCEKCGGAMENDIAAHRNLCIDCAADDNPGNNVILLAEINATIALSEKVGYSNPKVSKHLDDLLELLSLYFSLK